MSILTKQIEQYINYLTSYLAPETIRSYQGRLELFRLWSGDKESFTEKDLVDYLSSISYMKPGSQLTYITTLKNFFLWLYDTARIDSNPALRLRVKTPHTIPTAFSTSTIDEILSGFNEESFVGIRDKAFISLCYSACLRRGEIIELTLNDVDLTNREVMVRNAKFDKQRKAVFSMESLRFLEQYLLARHEYLAGEHSPWLWLSSTSKEPLSYSAVDGLNQRIKREHGNIDLFTLHKLRHSMATQMARYASNGNVGLVAKHLGHTELNTAFQHYIDFNVDDLHKVLE